MKVAVLVETGCLLVQMFAVIWRPLTRWTKQSDSGPGSGVLTAGCGALVGENIPAKSEQKNIVFLPNENKQGGCPGYPLAESNLEGIACMSLGLLLG